MFFRKFTVAKAQALQLVGWCANSARGTVVGECQGKPEALAAMKVRVDGSVGLSVGVEQSSRDRGNSVSSSCKRCGGVTVCALFQLRVPLPACLSTCFTNPTTPK